MRDIEKRLLKQLVIWLGIGIALSITINTVMFGLLGSAAFPWNLAVQMVAFMTLAIFYMRRQLAKMGGLSPGRLFGGPSELRYECRRCGLVYKGVSCKRCGSKGGRAIF